MLMRKPNDSPNWVCRVFIYTLYTTKSAVSPLSSSLSVLSLQRFSSQIFAHPSNILAMRCGQARRKRRQRRAIGLDTGRSTRAQPMLSLIEDVRECAVYAPCKYARVGIYKCFCAMAGIVHWKRRVGGVTSRRVGSKKERRKETGSGQAKSYKHWSSRGSGAGLEERLLNIQTEVEGSALNRKEATSHVPCIPAI